MSARAIATGAGVALVLAHAIALPALVRRFARADLIVTDGAAPAELFPRLTVEDDGAPGAGLQHRRWTARYRGGFTRAVGEVRLVGPFQDPARPACTARVVVGQRFLDDGRASPGTVAHTVVAAITGQMRGFHELGVGSFRRVSGVTVAWAERARRPGDLFLLLRSPPAAGYVRATATIVLDRVDVPIIVLLIPVLDRGALRFDVRVHAQLDFGNRVFNWISDKLDGDAFATRLAREQIGEGLIDALGPPPPLDLGHGHALRFDYCGRGPEVVDGAYASLPLAVAFAGPTGPERVLPPTLGAVASRPAPPPAGTVTLDLDLDAINAILYELWRTGFLDDELARAGLDRRFNDDATVQALLSIRLSPLRLPLPPVISAQPAGAGVGAGGGGTGLRLAAEAIVNIGDGTTTTLGRIWGGLDLRFRDPPAPAPSVGVDVALGPLELSCAVAPRALAPCYADLVAAMRDRAGDLHGVLTDVFTHVLTDLFVGRRVGADGVPAQLEIRGVRASAFAAAPTAIVRLELDAAVLE